MRHLHIIGCGLLLWVPGCALWKHGEVADYRTIEASPHHDTDTARQKNERALHLLEKGHLDHAERALQEALIADVTFAPAHNNLGQLYFQQGKMYLAAWEFEYAKQLMDHRPEPYNNLGLVFETVGRIAQSIEMYEIAYGMQPQNPDYIGNLARARLRRGDSDPAIAHLLDELRFYDTRPDWVAWANEQLAIGKISPSFELDATSQPISPNQLEILPSPTSAPSGGTPDGSEGSILQPTPATIEAVPLIPPVRTSWISPPGAVFDRVEPAGYELPATIR